MTARNRRIAVVVGLIAAAFSVSYVYAASSAPAPGGDRALATAGPVGARADASSSAAGCACCGGSGSGEQIEGATEVAGDVQTIEVDASQGMFAPNRIVAKAGVPIEIEFSQAPGGCLSAVLFPDFGIEEDLTAGPKTVELPALEPGEYSFSCQMRMIFGTLIVQ